MNPSKENCRKAQGIVSHLAESKGCVVGNTLSDVEVEFLEQFLDRCEAKLPYEKSFKKKFKCEEDL